MKRVLVIGSCGAGKSTFSKRLHEITGLNLIHLDKFYHLPNWEEPPKEVWEAKVRELISGEEWIIDGNYGGSMDMRLERADSAIWLDLPRTVCTYRILKRVFQYRNKKRPDMAEGCFERFDWEFIKYVWNFPRDKNPAIEMRLKKYPNVKIYRLKKKQRDREFLR